MGVMGVQGTSVGYGDICRERNGLEVGTEDTRLLLGAS